MRPGDKAFIVEANNQIREVEIIEIIGDFVTLRYDYSDPHYISSGKHHITSKGGMRLRKGRVFQTREGAEEHIKGKIK